MQTALGHLRYSSDKSPGFLRQKAGKNFKYYDATGKVIKTKETLSRIESLVIPPAWRDVWICALENGHLQATGIDEKRRKQYIYHPDWIKMSQQNKFDKIIAFGLSLPKVRQRVEYNLRSKEMDKKTILSTIIWLLEHTFIRIGNEEYAQENDSFGLTTLRNRHVKVWGSSVTFQFKGKSGVPQTLEISHPTVAKTIKKCTEIPGFELFQYIDDAGDRHVIDSEDVNLFLKEVTGDDFSAKDFRTWGATSICANSFYKIGFPEDKKLLKKNIVETVRKVATHLNNTVSVCRNYYIHPAVVETYQKNILVPHFDQYSRSKTKAVSSNRGGLSWDEQALIKLLQNN